MEATKNKLEPALVQIDATLARNQLAIKATVRQKPLQTLTADAALTFDGEKVVAMPSSILNAPLTAHITLPDSDLSVLPSFVPALASIKGTASMEAHVSGPLRQPEWQGAIRADAIRATLKDSDLDIRDIKVRASFKGQIITLDDVSTSLSGGRMTAGGTVDITQLSDPALNLQLKSKEALIVRDDTMSMRADGDLTCSGTLSKAVVAGRVELVRGRVFKEIEFLPLSLPDQLPPPPPLVRTSTAKLSAPGPFGQWNLNMDIVTRDPIRLLGNVLNGAAVVNLHVSGTGAVPVLEGKISQQGAHVRLPFSNLALSRGDIIFTKERPFEPMLDLQGDSLVSNYQVTLYATGPAANPTLRFASSPPLTEPEIATLLATGATAGNAQTTGGVAANRLAFLVFSKAYHKLFGKAEPIRKVEEPGRLSLSLNPLSTGTTPGSFDATYEVNPQVQAKIGLGEHGVRGQLSYLIRFR